MASYYFMGLVVAPSQLVEHLGPWLQAMNVTMSTSISRTDKYLGWLAFSAPEYDIEALCKIIHQITGVDVALQHYQ